MPKVEREDGGDLTAVLTVTVERNEYEPKFKTELGKYQKQAHMKGFRKGKTPMSVVRKLYGKSVLAEVVNGLLQEELYRYLTEGEVNILGQPIPSDDQDNFDFDVKNLEDFVFKFDIGLAPDFEVKGVSESDEYEKYDIEVTDQMVNEDLENAQRRLGDREVSEGEILEGDLLKLQAKELDGETVKEEGIESSFNLLIDNVDNETAKKQLLESKVGDVLTLNLFELQDSTDDDYVRKYFLNLTEDEEEEEAEEGDQETEKQELNREFEVTIEEVSRIKPAEMGQEFFDKYFGEGEISSEEEAREKIVDNIKKHYSNQAGALLFRDMQERLIKENELELPDHFLKRWLQANNEGVPDEDIDKEYGSFSENLKWSLIRGRLVKDMEVSVEADEVLEQFKNQIRGYFGGAAGNDELIENMARRFMEDEKQVDSVYQNLLTDKLAVAIEEKVTIVPKPISVADFEGVVEQAQEEVRKARESDAAEEE